MTKSTLSLFIVLAYGAAQSLATTTPSIQLQIGSSPSGCADIAACNYGCARFSSESIKHALTPVCESEDLSDEYPKQITIRGSTVTPYIIDEDTSDKYTCSKTAAKGRTYLCTLDTGALSSKSRSFNEDSISSLSASASVSKSESASAMSSSGSPIIFRDIKGVSKPVQCEFFPGIAGKGTRKGSHNDCCLSSIDCSGICFRGACADDSVLEGFPSVPYSPSPSPSRSPPSPPSPPSSPSSPKPSPVELAAPNNCAYNPTIFRQHQGQGNLDDCCWTNDDCHGACIEGACNSENNVPVPVCSGNAHKGKGLGQGKKGACCNSQADCQENCIYNTCTAPLNY